MIDFYKFNYLSVMGRNAGKMKPNEFLINLLSKYDNVINEVNKSKDRNTN